MAGLSGKAGRVLVGGPGVAVARITNWALNTKADAVDVTGTSSSGHKEFVAGLDEWSGTAKCHYDSAETKFTGAPPTIVVGAVVTLLLGVDDGAGETWTGTALITGVDVELDVAGDITFNISFQGTGALTYPA